MVSVVLNELFWMPLILFPAKTLEEGKSVSLSPTPRTAEAPATAVPARNLRRFRYTLLGVISDDRMSSAILISMGTPVFSVYAVGVAKNQMWRTRKSCRTRSGRAEFWVLRAEAWGLRREVGIAYPRTSLNLRDRFCSVNGFCRKAVPFSMDPSLTMASSVYPER